MLSYEHQISHVKNLGQSDQLNSFNIPFFFSGRLSFQHFDTSEHSADLSSTVILQNVSSGYQDGVSLMEVRILELNAFDFSTWWHSTESTDLI